MKNTILKEPPVTGSDEILKATALLYFQDALFTEEFESCKELIDYAKKFGAQQSDIKAVIATYINKKTGVKSEAKSRIR